jgi:hypothetical protein
MPQPKSHPPQKKKPDLLFSWENAVISTYNKLKINTRCKNLKNITTLKM